MKDNIFKSDNMGRVGDSAFEFMDTMNGHHSSKSNHATAELKTKHAPAKKSTTTHKAAAPKKHAVAMKSDDCAAELKKKPAVKKAVAHKAAAPKKHAVAMKSDDCAAELKKAVKKTTTHATAKKSATHATAKAKTSMTAHKPAGRVNQPKRSNDDDYVIVGEIVTIEY